MILLLSIFASAIVIIAVFALLMWVKTPHYQPDKVQVIRLLEWMLLGQASDNDWRVFCGYPLRHNEELEQVRQLCVDIDEHYYIGDTRAGHLLSRDGLQELEKVLRALKATPLNQK
ncbi:MAG: hypothetical protein CL693_12680 [Cellvibrionaceae bacterium]|mgnify:CR=1 FL=1|nr:hypothetical protein [Cellvibrionaceae bacterium]|tara:strand:+ start:126 stop:473 length:348 start_codon:yes stop_codon:yes gene_type:complete